ncbi:F0F1 ATP synthase subunit delta, partial [Mobiluncus curtisii]
LTDNHRASLDQRLETFNSLVGEGVKPLALRLVNAVIAKAAPGRLTADLRALLDSAARLRQRAIATVYTATPLSDTQKSRLIQLLSTRTGEQVEVNVVVDQKLVGGIK